LAFHPEGWPAFAKAACFYSCPYRKGVGGGVV
jgi:hypothetical protein